MRSASVILVSPMTAIVPESMGAGADFGGSAFLAVAASDAKPIAKPMNATTVLRTDLEVIKTPPLPLKMRQKKLTQRKKKRTEPFGVGHGPTRPPPPRPRCLL